MKTRWMSPSMLALALSSGSLPMLAIAQESVEGSAPLEAEAPASAADASISSVPVDPAAEPPPNAAESAADDGSRSRLTGEIIVTAQKREENAQDVPITIQAFSADALDALGVKSTQQLQSVTPSLNFGEFVGYSIIFMRGVGTDAFLTADPSITTYVDGVYLPSSFGQSADFGEIERVEVLKGPQGTLFGRNAVGGALAVYTSDPKLDRAFLDIATNYGSFSDTNTKATVNVPLTDTFAIALSGNYHQSDFQYDGSYARDASSGGRRSYEPEVSKGYRLKMLWQPMDELLDFMAAHSYNVFVGYTTSVTPVVEPTLLSQGAAALLSGGENSDPQADYTAELDVAGLGYYSDLTYGRIGIHPGPVDIKVFGSYQYTGNRQFYDFDGSATPLAEFVSDSRNGTGTRAVTSELQILSNDESPWSDWLQWVGGVYYFESQAGFRSPATLYLNSIDPLTTLLLGLGATGAQITNLQALQNLVDQAPTGRAGFSSGVATDSIAGYAQVTTKLTDWLSLALGGRYQDEKREVNESGTWLEQSDGSFLEAIDRADQHKTTKSFSPKVSLEIHPVDDLMLYTSYQEATKSGTYNAVNIYDTIDYVKPEKMKAYEVGVKTELLDGARLNVAGWLYKQRNLQTQFVSLLKGGAVSFETAGAAKSKGVEFDLNWLVLPSLVDDLVVIASGAYVDAKYTSYPNASGFDQTTGLLQENLDFTGNRVPQAAKYTASLQLNKAFRIASLNSTLELGGDLYYNDGFFWTAQNVEASREPNYYTYGARASWLYEPADLRVTAYGINIGDDDHNQQMFTTDFGVVRYQGKQSEFGVRVEARFD